MSAQYTPLKAGSGTKVHAGIVTGEVTAENRKFGQRIGKTYRSLCTLTNTHIVSRDIKLFLLPEGTEITCEACLRKIAKRESK